MTTYDARQCSLPNSPASTTPAEMPTPRLAPQAALARARSWPGVVAAARAASPQARTAAPPTPWTTLAATKSPVPSARTQATAPRPRTTSPPTSVRRRPIRSSHGTGRQQRRRQADAHRAHHPGAGTAAAVQVDEGVGHRGHGGDVGDQDEPGAQRDQGQRGRRQGGRRRVDTKFDFRTHSQHDSGMTATRQRDVPLVRLADLPGRPCAIAASLEVVGERWALLVVREVGLGARRFNEIVAGTGAPRDRIASRLSTLVEAGVLEKRQYQSAPPRFEYSPDRVRPGAAARARGSAGVGAHLRRILRRPRPEAAPVGTPDR